MKTFSSITVVVFMKVACKSPNFACWFPRVSPSKHQKCIKREKLTTKFLQISSLHIWKAFICLNFDYCDKQFTSFACRAKESLDPIDFIRNF